MSSSLFLSWRLAVLWIGLVVVVEAAPPPELRPVSNPMPAMPAGVVDVSTVSTPPVPVSQARPRYPVELRQAGVRGEAGMLLVVSTAGKVTDATVIRATDERFGSAAREAVLKWTFKPAQRNGAPVACRLYVPIVFAVGARVESR